MYGLLVIYLYGLFVKYLEIICCIFDIWIRRLVLKEFCRMCVLYEVIEKSVLELSNVRDIC